jgi:hypothetical protein
MNTKKIAAIKKCCSTEFPDTFFSHTTMQSAGKK